MEYHQLSAVLVLTDQHLLRYINEFVNGFPLPIQEFYASINEEEPRMHLQNAIVEGNDIAAKYLFHLFHIEYYMQREYHVELQLNNARSWSVQYSRIELLKWLVARERLIQQPCKPYILDLALRNGQFEIAQYLWANCPEGCLSIARDSLDKVAALDNLEFIVWVHESLLSAKNSIRTIKYGFTTNAIKHAAQNGHLHTMQYLIENKLATSPSDLISIAKKARHQNIIQYLLNL